MAKTDSYLGTGWAFPPTFVRSQAAGEAATANRGGVAMVSDYDDIDQALGILLDTSPGERVLQPSYGAGLKNQVFEPMNASVLTFIEDLVRTAVIYHEPRVEIEDITVVPDQLGGRLFIKIKCLVPETNSRFNFVHPFYLNETGQKP